VLIERNGTPSTIATYLALCSVLFCYVSAPALARHRHAAPPSPPISAYPPIEGRPVSAALRMSATAYTAYCGGRCSGRTALGWQAGYGIVAVDPRVIPLRTRLYIPGYGYAVAGDVGGSIKGARIDLGFNTYRDARQFGRRDIIVYILQ
jgi:3D (Asp-Asp-Asp) domain-containing protein